MPNFTVKNIPAELYNLLKESAAANRRSINSEIIFWIEQGVANRQHRVTKVLQEARQLRQKTQDCPISEAEFQTAKEDGRP